jgi:hypothetical protein
VKPSVARPGRKPVDLPRRSPDLKSICAQHRNKGPAQSPARTRHPRGATTRLAFTGTH